MCVCVERLALGHVIALCKHLVVAGEKGAEISLAQAGRHEMRSYATYEVAEAALQAIERFI